MFSGPCCSRRTATAALLALLLLICGLFRAGETAAQGFNLVNERNHPHLEWRMAETEHFRIVYPAHIEGIEIEAAAIAETVYDSLSQNFGIRFERKIRIYLTDEDEISNGFAVPAGGGYTNIWVHLNDYAERLTGRKKWLRRVIAHELAHIFHFEATRTPLGLINYLIAEPMPRAWAEGVAQYQSEVWDSERGDRWLRLAVFDGRPDPGEASWLYRQRLLYAAGHSQVRFFAESYGDSTLAALFADRDTLAGPLQRHHFRSAFRRAAGISWEEFREEWRKQVNVYYHTLASQMERADSLGVGPERLPGRYFFDVAWSSDRSRIAVLALPSLQRPVRSLYLVEGDTSRTARVLVRGEIRSGIDWSPQGDRIVYSKLVRGENGSLLHDLFLYDLERDREVRLTRSRRAISPVFSPDGKRIAAIVNERGTGHILLLDLESGEERYLLRHRGDVQLITLAWNRPRDELVFQRFDAEGDRHLVRFDPHTGRERILDPGEGSVDNRRQVISPDGNRIAFTSLRDEVPNLFVTDLESDSTWRVTRLFTGAYLFDWLDGEECEEGVFAVRASERMRSESIYLVSASRRTATPDPIPPAPYAGWRTHGPPSPIPERIEPDPATILSRERYRSFRNLHHGFTMALPWFAGGRSYGLAAVTGWWEPLGKHAIAAGGNLSPGRISSSGGFISYLDNRLGPAMLLSLYHMPLQAQFYGTDLLVENRTGADLALRWPVGAPEESWRKSWFGLRLRYASADPHLPVGDSFPAALPLPEGGTELSLRAAWVLRNLTPWYRNRIHPVEGYGVRFSLAAAAPVAGGERSWLAADADGYLILPGPGHHRFVLRGRIQSGLGSPAPQHWAGFSRIDRIHAAIPLEWGFMRELGQERVRGYRSTIAGRHVAFGSLEYRVPLLPSLRTSILGLLRLSTTSLALFSDAGAVGDVFYSDFPDPQRFRAGAGGELRNLLRIGPLDLGHSIGVARPWSALLERETDLYYRVEATLPF